MITARLAQESDINDCKDFLKENDLIDLFNENDFIYILKEDENLIGISQMKVINKYAILEYVIIDKKSRGNYFGDGLLRSILNYIYTNNITDVYFLEDDEFLKREGFKTVSKEEVADLLISKVTKNVLYLNLSEFFSLGCKSSRR